MGQLLVTGARNAEDARAYYAKEFLDYRRKKPTPYMDGLRFSAAGDAADPDRRVLSNDDLSRAEEEGERAA